MKIIITCETAEDKIVAKHFISWLCGQGEQDYWTWMAAREIEEDGNISIMRFEYDFDKQSVTGIIGRVSK